MPNNLGECDIREEKIDRKIERQRERRKILGIFKWKLYRTEYASKIRKFTPSKPTWQEQTSCVNGLTPMTISSVLY